MLTPITDRVTIVTGASRGIGLGIARAFAAQGACVLVVARDGNADKAVADELTAQGGTASGFAGNVTDTAAVHAMAAAAEESMAASIFFVPTPASSRQRVWTR